jgi:hypothetical protein
MSTRFTRRRKRVTNNEPVMAPSTKATAAEPTAASSSSHGDLKKLLYKAYDFVSLNPMARGRILWVKTEGNRVYAATDDRYLSNALYHALRALGRNRVRRWLQDGKWIIAYS